MKNHPSQWIASGLACRDVAARASEHLDETLPLLMKVRMGLHLASCADCRVYVRQVALVREALSRLPKQLPSPIIRLRLRQSLLRHCAH